MTELKQYLRERKVVDSNYLDSITTEDLNKNKFSLFSVDGQEYMLSHFFDNSDELGYGLTKTNHILKTENTNMVAIAIVEGDDVVCINTTDNSIWLWCLQTGNGEFVKIINSFEEFKSMVIL